MPRRNVSHIIRSMERIALLKARIALYRRYLKEGVDGELATAYLWLIRQDEIELTALTDSRKKEAAPETARRPTED